MTDDFENGISHIHQSPMIKKRLAKESHQFNQKKHPQIYQKIQELKKYRLKFFPKKCDDNAWLKNQQVLEQHRQQDQKLKLEIEFTIPK